MIFLIELLRGPTSFSGCYATSPESRAALPSPQAPAKSQRSEALEQLQLSKKTVGISGRSGHQQPAIAAPHPSKPEAPRKKKKKLPQPRHKAPKEEEKKPGAPRDGLAGHALAGESLPRFGITIFTKPSACLHPLPQTFLRVRPFALRQLSNAQAISRCSANCPGPL